MPELHPDIVKLKPVITQIHEALKAGQKDTAITYAVETLVPLIKDTRVAEGIISEYSERIKELGRQTGDIHMRLTGTLLEGALELRSGEHADKDPVDYLTRKLENKEKMYEGAVRRQSSWSR